MFSGLEIALHVLRAAHLNGEGHPIIASGICYVTNPRRCQVDKVESSSRPPRPSAANGAIIIGTLGPCRLASSADVAHSPNGRGRKFVGGGLSGRHLGGCRVVHHPGM